MSALWSCKSQSSDATAQLGMYKAVTRLQNHQCSHSGSTPWVCQKHGTDLQERTKLTLQWQREQSDIMQQRQSEVRLQKI